MADAADKAAQLKAKAEAGDNEARTAYGNMLLDGSDGVTLDVTAGIDMLRDAADDGYADAQFHLGEAFANGRGTRASEFNGKRYLKLAAKQGHEGAVEELKRHFWA